MVNACHLSEISELSLLKVDRNNHEDVKYEKLNRALLPDVYL